MGREKVNKNSTLKIWVFKSLDFAIFITVSIILKKNQEKKTCKMHNSLEFYKSSVFVL